MLLGSKLTGRPVKWISTRSEAFLCDAQARDNVTEAELALDKDGHFLGLRVSTIANLGAYLQIRRAILRRQSRHARGRLPHAGDPCRRDGGLHQHQSDAALSRQRPARGRLCDRAHGRPRRRRARHRPGRAAPAQLHPAGGDAVQDRAHLHLRLRRVREEHGRGACAWPTSPASRAPRGIAQARQAARPRHLEHHRARGRAAASRARRSASIAAARSTLFSGSHQPGPGPRDHLQADRLRPARPRSRQDVIYVQGDTDKVVVGEGTGGSRSAALGGSAVACAADKIDREGQADRRAPAQGRVEDVKFEDGVFSSPDQPTLDHRRVAARRPRPGKLPTGMEAGLIAASIFYARRPRISPTAAMSARSRSTRRPAQVEIVRYSVVDDVGTVMNPLLLEGQIHGGIVQGVGQMLMEDIRFDPDSGQLVTGSFMDYAMPRADDFCAIDIDSQPGADQTNPLGVKGAGEAGCVGALPAVANALVDALSRLGVRHIEMPATPERMWRAIQERADEGGGGVREGASPFPRGNFARAAGVERPGLKARASNDHTANPRIRHHRRDDGAVRVGAAALRPRRACWRCSSRSSRASCPTTRRSPASPTTSSSSSDRRCWSARPCSVPASSRRCCGRLRPRLTATTAQVAVLAGSVALLSAFVKNIGALAMMMPVAFQLARKNRPRSSHLLMPMAFALAARRHRHAGRHLAQHHRRPRARGARRHSRSRCSTSRRSAPASRSAA